MKAGSASPKDQMAGSLPNRTVSLAKPGSVTNSSPGISTSRSATSRRPNQTDLPTWTASSIPKPPSFGPAGPVNPSTSTPASKPSSPSNSPSREPTTLINKPPEGRSVLIAPYDGGGRFGHWG